MMGRKHFQLAYTCKVHMIPSGRQTIVPYMQLYTYRSQLESAVSTTFSGTHTYSPTSS